MALIERQTYLLDTNMVRYIVSGRSRVARRTMEQTAAVHKLATSAIVEGEILYELVRRPEAKLLRASVEAIFFALTVLPWDSTAALAYSAVRGHLSSIGKTLPPLDMLIAAHAISAKAILVTHDRAFLQVQGLATVDWADDV